MQWYLPNQCGRISIVKGNVKLQVYFQELRFPSRETENFSFYRVSYLKILDIL